MSEKNHYKMSKNKCKQNNELKKIVLKGQKKNVKKSITKCNKLIFKK